MLHYTSISFVAILLCWSVVSTAADKPRVFNHISGQRTEVDNLVHEYFGNLYDVVDIDDRQHAYVPPRGTHGFGAPPAPVFIGGRCIRGDVLVHYVITIEGLVSSPYVGKSSDPLLSNFAIERVSKRRFRAAQVDGKSVSSIAATRVVFSCPSEPGSAGGPTATWRSFAETPLNFTRA